MFQWVCIVLTTILRSPRMLPTTKHLIRSPHAQILPLRYCTSRCLLFSVTKTYFYNFKSEPQTLHTLCFTCMRLSLHKFQVCGTQKAAMPSLWEVCNNSMTAYVTTYFQMVGASSFFKTPLRREGGRHRYIRSLTINFLSLL